MARVGGLAAVSDYDFEMGKVLRNGVRLRTPVGGPVSDVAWVSDYDSESLMHDRSFKIGGLRWLRTVARVGSLAPVSDYGFLVGVG